MKYLFQIIVMGSDLLVIGFLILTIISFPNFLTLILVTIGLFTWFKNDGFIAWKPNFIRNFLRNWEIINKSK